TIRGQDHVVRAQVAIDGPGLGRTFDDDDVLQWGREGRLLGGKVRRKDGSAESGGAPPRLSTGGRILPKALSLPDPNWWRLMQARGVEVRRAISSHRRPK